MNIDNGSIRPWDSLSADEKESGRWVKLSDDEFAMAAPVEEARRSIDLREILGREHPFYDKKSER